MKFRTQWDSEKPRFIAEPGSKEADVYEIQIDKRGHKTLKLVGTRDIYEEIQSYAEECDIKNIIARASAGDVNALNQRQGYYADITETPANLAEAQNAILKLSQGFDKLPAEVREKFDNSKERFVMEFGSEDWYKAMGFTTESPNKTENIEFVPGTKEAAQPLTPEGGNN